MKSKLLHEAAPRVFVLVCGVAQQAFDFGRRHLHSGMSETEAAALVRGSLSIAGTGHEGIGRGDGFAWCMSGPNSFHAKTAYARSRARQINPGEFVLMHCNSYADGYWTDITRTYVIGELDQRQRQMYGAVFAAREAAFAAIVPGVAASQVDRAAREVLQSRGFGQKEFPHPTGHGVGFASISANARPRIHPKSEEILEPGMVFNIEPAVYVEGLGGIRHCDLVAVTSNGMDLLTDFHSAPADLLLPLRQPPVRLAG